MVKLVVLFDLSIEVTKRSLNLFYSLEHYD